MGLADNAGGLRDYCGHTRLGCLIPASVSPKIPIKGLSVVAILLNLIPQSKFTHNPHLLTTKPLQCYHPLLPNAFLPYLRRRQSACHLAYPRRLPPRCFRAHKNHPVACVNDVEFRSLLVLRLQTPKVLLARTFRGESKSSRQSLSIPQSLVAYPQLSRKM